MPENATMTVTVHVTPGFRFRLWVAKKLFSLACFVLGCGFVMRVNQEWKGGPT